MTKILVTGSTGQLGQALRSVSDLYSSLSLHFFSKQELDITDTNAVESALTSQPWDYVINCAALTKVDLAETEPEKALLINGKAPAILAKACKRNGIHLIHISTDYVFDGEKGSPYTPHDLPNPINQYGATKWEGEKAIQAIGGDFSIIRTSWLYSEFGKNFYTNILKKEEAGEPLYVTNEHIGSPTYAKNLANHILTRTKNSCILKGISHFSDGEAMTWLELAKKIVKEKKIKTSITGSKKQQASTLRPFKSVITD